MGLWFEPLAQVVDERLRFAVIVSRHGGKWIYCKHRDRSTWEVPGGTREPGEAILDTARRELWEETGAASYQLTPIQAYCYNGTYGLLCFAEVDALESLPCTEIERIELFDREPDNLTYPHIQPHLFQRVLAHLGEPSVEFLDLYDGQHRAICKTVPRWTPAPPGEYYLVAEVWTVNSRGEILLTLRAPEKRRHPCLWECTAGAVLAGETSRQGAVRELWEETGIAATEEELFFLGTHKMPDALMDIYLLHRDMPIHEVTLQQGETTDAKWVTLEQLDQMIAENALSPSVGTRLQSVRGAFEGHLYRG